MRALFFAALLATTSVPAAAWAEPADVAASVAATASRTEANVKLDEGRKPAELLSFLGLHKAGQHEAGYLLPFEIISVHLLVVLIAAAYLARTKKRATEKT